MYDNLKQKNVTFQYIKIQNNKNVFFSTLKNYKTTYKCHF